MEFVTSTSAVAVIPKFDRVFSTHGIPEKLISDNGPPFQSNEWARYMKSWGIKHVPDTPLRPQGNAEAEAFMRPFKKLLQTCQIENKDKKKELYQFLLNYRSSPHCVTGIPPAQLLFNRTIRAKIPHIPESPAPVNKHKDLAGKEKKIKKKAKEY